MRRLAVVLSGHQSVSLPMALCLFGASSRGCSTSIPPPPGPSSSSLHHNVDRTADYNDGTTHKAGNRKTTRKGPHSRKHKPRSVPRHQDRGAAAASSSAVPQSLDLAEATGSVDVEKFFPAAMSHLKAPPTAPHVADEQKTRWWSDATHVVNADGFQSPERETLEERESRVHSFFDQGSLDIRGGIRDAKHLPTAAEATSPDILQLSGGNARLHGMALAEKSNVAPADQTVEGDETENDFGDTPVQITDMLRERLMELKASKLKEDREDTYMPRRLRLQSDADLAASKQLQAQASLLRLAQKKERGRTTTLADLEDNEGDGRRDEGAASAPAIIRDGVLPESRVSASRALGQADVYVPGARHGEDPLSEMNWDANGRARGTGDPSAAGDGVYLMRVLPRASFCSRREASGIIASGQVKVNNVTERNPFRIIRAEDDVLVEGHKGRLRFAPPRLWVYHKPANVIVSRNDVAGRTLISKHARILGFEHLIPVGSLPMKAHGILLLTNDGELSSFLANPKSNIQQTYMLRVRPAVDPTLAHKLNTEGININGRQYRDVEFMVNPAMKSRHSLKVKVRGETMPIAHLMQHLGRTIERGGRVSYGPFSLATLPVGSVREVTVPPVYAMQLGAVWKPFVERDWPYFRRQRVAKLRKLCRFRELSPRELEELDHYTYEEVKDSLSLESAELSAAAAEQAALMSRSHAFGDASLPPDFPTASDQRGGAFYNDGDIPPASAWAEEDAIMEDITKAV